MDTHLLSSLSSFDRALQERAKGNAAAAVRDGQVHAAERREAADAMAVQAAVQAARVERPGA